MPAELTLGNRLTLLNSGREYFPVLLAAIAEARHEIHLESYIFANDVTGRAIAAGLMEAAQRGVTVRVLVDGFGARNFESDFLMPLAAAGVQAMLFRRELASFRFRRHRLRRLHRKLAVIDGRLAFIGGINVVDDDNAPEDLRPRFDYAVKAEGPVVVQIHRAVHRLWEVVVWANFKQRYRLERRRIPRCEPVGLQSAGLVVRDNIRHRNDIANAYLDAIRSAQSEIIIANAYFLPGLRFRHALFAAARRGVKVTILLQGRSDHPLVYYATRTLYGALVKEGIRVLEYRKSFLHAKVAVVDGRWATVGSSNIDPFSLLLAKEANLVAMDHLFAGELRASLHAAMDEGAVELRSEDLTRMSWHSRLRSWLAYELVRLLVGWAGYGPRHWRSDEDKPGQETTGSVSLG